MHSLEAASKGRWSFSGFVTTFVTCTQGRPHHNGREKTVGGRFNGKRATIVHILRYIQIYTDMLYNKGERLWIKKKKSENIYLSS